MSNDLEVAKKLVQLSQSAKSRNIEFGMSLKKVKKLLTNKTCFYTRVRFREGDLARSIDRVDSAKGYTDDNVVACTVNINGKKGNLTEKEIIQMYNGIMKLKKDDNGKIK